MCVIPRSLRASLCETPSTHVHGGARAFSQNTYSVVGTADSIPPARRPSTPWHPRGGGARRAGGGGLAAAGGQVRLAPGQAQGAPRTASLPGGSSARGRQGSHEDRMRAVATSFLPHLLETPRDGRLLQLIRKLRSRVTPVRSLQRVELSSPCESLPATRRPSGAAARSRSRSGSSRRVASSGP